MGKQTPMTVSINPARRPPVKSKPNDIQRIKNVLGVSSTSDENFCRSLPFSVNDTAAGSENELQAVVSGDKMAVDLPVVIKASRYYKNMLKRAASGEFSKKAVISLEQFLDDNTENVWENSWVRFPRGVLNHYAENVFERDLLADKKDWPGPKRQDATCFTVYRHYCEYVRVPVSYLLKLSLADSLGTTDVHPMIRGAGKKFLGHFSNDNTSPETFSFYPAIAGKKTDIGGAAAQETLLRYLLSQFLTEYANEKFQLTQLGQKAEIYFAPNPPVRQKLLNELTSDSFYRKLFMSPCLSGWDKGEKKSRYMHLCHQVLSRSQLNAVAKLKDAGIIVNNLVVLPNMSNICLANNGTHISLSSQKITSLLKAKSPEFNGRDEKYLGDLAIKIIEHFLPLFVNSYSAAPYRLAFTNFHPERALGFLPHELDFTHLRMIWRRWKKKAALKFCGQPITPFGPEWLDRTISKLFGLKGDFVNDFRLIDYLVSLLSTDESPGLDGELGNDLRLKDDLAAMGVFHTAMPVYLLYRIRRFSEIGFSGFEGRHYSLFADIFADMSHSVNLQTLITGLAYKYILHGRFGHEHIPDYPSIESERRQIFFGTAIGIPTFYVRSNTQNLFLADILNKVRGTRFSRRYPGYLRVYNVEFRKALIRILKEDAADLIEMNGFEETIRDLEQRINDSANHSAGGKLTRAVCEKAGIAHPMKIQAQEFNRIAEKFYREDLKQRHIKAALDLMEDLVKHQLSNSQIKNKSICRAAIAATGTNSPEIFFKDARKKFLTGRFSNDLLQKMIHLTILMIDSQKERFGLK